MNQNFINLTFKHIKHLLKNFIKKSHKNLHNSKYSNNFALVKRKLTSGEMAEWSIAAVLKTVEGNTSGGSNPSLSAKSLSEAILRGFFDAQQDVYICHIVQIFR